jgi:hypothetical protein
MDQKLEKTEVTVTSGSTCVTALYKKSKFDRNFGQYEYVIKRKDGAKDDALFFFDEGLSIVEIRIGRHSDFYDFFKNRPEFRRLAMQLPKTPILSTMEAERRARRIANFFDLHPTLFVRLITEHYTTRVLKQYDGFRARLQLLPQFDDNWCRMTGRLVPYLEYFPQERKRKRGNKATQVTSITSKLN